METTLGKRIIQFLLANIEKVVPGWGCSTISCPPDVVSVCQPYLFTVANAEESP